MLNTLELEKKSFVVNIDRESVNPFTFLQILALTFYIFPITTLLEIISGIKYFNFYNKVIIEPVMSQVF